MRKSTEGQTPPFPGGSYPAGSVTGTAGRDLHGSHFQRFFVNSYVYLAPELTFWTTMLASIPLAFAFGLDPRAVDKEVSWALGTTIRQVHVQCLLTSAQCAEIRRRPIQTRQTQQALNDPRSPVGSNQWRLHWLTLPKRHSEQHLQAEARLDRRITETLGSPALTIRRRNPDHLGDELNGQ